MDELSCQWQNTSLTFPRIEWTDRSSRDKAWLFSLLYYVIILRSLLKYFISLQLVFLICKVGMMMMMMVRWHKVLKKVVRGAIKKLRKGQSAFHLQYVICTSSSPGMVNKQYTCYHSPFPTLWQTLLIDHARLFHWVWPVAWVLLSMMLPVSGV